MKSQVLGTDTFEVEVTNIDRHGIWLLVQGEEYFLPFSEFPWFENAPVSSILRVELVHEGHLFWSELDIDLTMSSLKKPSKYPLIWQH